MGDITKRQKCHKPTTDTDSNTGYQDKSNCDDEPQSSYNPQYENMIPKFSKYYAQYATDYCILKVGRRGRQLGMGAYLRFEGMNKRESLHSMVFHVISIFKNTNSWLFSWL